MFDTHVSESKVVAVTRVVEKSITPDKVTEMYDKVRAEVEGDIIQKVLVSSDLLQAVVIVSHEYKANKTHRIVSAFKLNGRTFEDTTLEYHQETGYILTEMQMFARVAAHYSKVVGMLLAEQAFNQTTLKTRGK